MGKGGGGGGPTQTTSTVQNTNIPEYAKGYVENMLGTTQQQLFTGNKDESGNFNITGFKPYQAYGGTYDQNQTLPDGTPNPNFGKQTSYDPSKAIAGFSPTQQAAQQGIAGMQVPTQAYGSAQQMVNDSAIGAGQSSQQALGYGAMGQQAGMQGQQSGMMGQRYGMQAGNNAGRQANAQMGLANQYGMAGYGAGQTGQNLGIMGGANYGGQGAGYGQEAAGMAGQAAGYGQAGMGIGQQASGLSGNALGYGQGSADIGQQATGLSSNALGYGNQGAGYGSQGAGFGQQAAGLSSNALGYGNQGAGYGSQGAELGQQAAGLSSNALGYGNLGVNYGGQGANIGQQAANLSSNALGYGNLGVNYGSQGANIGQQASNLAGNAMNYGDVGLGYGQQASQLAGSALGYGQNAADIGQMGLRAQGMGENISRQSQNYARQAAGAGSQYAQQATNPNAIQAYMSPYMQNVVDVQNKEAQRNAAIAGTQQQSDATKAGAFGGSRDAIMRAERERNLATLMNQNQAQGLQNAFQQAQQAQQYGANLNLQGLQGAQQGLGTALQGGQLGLSGVGTALQGQQGALAGVGQAGAMYGLGMQGAQTGMQGVNAANQAYQTGLQGTAQGMQGAQTGLQGINAANQTYQTGLQGTAQGMQGAGMGLQGVNAANQAYQTGLQGAQTGMQGAGMGLQGVNAANQAYLAGIQGSQAGMQGAGMGLQGVNAANQAYQTGLQGQQGALQGVNAANQAYQTGLQGAQTGLQGINAANQTYQTGIQGAGMGLQGVNAQLAGTAQGMQGAQSGLAGVNAATNAGQYGLQGAQVGLQGTAQGMQGAGMGLQGAQAGLAGVQGAQAGYNMLGQQGMNYTNMLGQQQANQLGLYGAQNAVGAQQQALEQAKINQAMQDYANAQQYPLMQLGTMSNMLRGLPMQASTTNQYAASPNPLSQAVGTIGAGASIYNAFRPPGGASGGLPKEFKFAKGGITSIPSYDMGGEVESQLESMGEEELARQAKESSSPSIRKMAQRLLRERQMSKQPQGTGPMGVQYQAAQPQMPAMRGGGIIAFKTGGGANEEGGEEEARGTDLSGKTMDQRLATAAPATPPAGGIMAAAPVTQVRPETPPINVQPGGVVTPAMAEMQNRLFAQQAQAQKTADRPLSEFVAEKEKLLGPNTARDDFRSQIMAERANMKDEQERQRNMRLAEFFASWGTTPGPVLVAGMTALKQSIPNIIADQKEARKVEREANKIIYDLDQATRLEKQGNIKESISEKNDLAKRAEDLNKTIAQIQERQMTAEANIKGHEITAKGHVDAAAITAAAHKNSYAAAEKRADENTRFHLQSQALATKKAVEAIDATIAKEAETALDYKTAKRTVNNTKVDKKLREQSQAIVDKYETDWTARKNNAKDEHDLAKSQLAEVNAKLGLGKKPEGSATTPPPAPAAAAAAPSVTIGGKTFTKPDNMSAAQWEEYKKSQGVK